MSNITIYQGHTPPANPGGITVVIDVIRAFTTAHEAFHGGVRDIHLVATAQEALQLKDQHPDWLLAGEINALPIAGFDFGNSPWEIRQANLDNRSLVQRTTNGVIATLAAKDSQTVLVAGLINAEATANWIIKQEQSGTRPVLLVASHPSGDEDLACAQYLCALLGQQGIGFNEATDRTTQSYAAEKFLRGDNDNLRAADIHIAASNAGEHGLVMGVDYDSTLPCLFIQT